MQDDNLFEVGEFARYTAFFLGAQVSVIVKILEVIRHCFQWSSSSAFWGRYIPRQRIKYHILLSVQDAELFPYSQQGCMFADESNLEKLTDIERLAVLCNPKYYKLDQ